MAQDNKTASIIDRRVAFWVEGWDAYHQLTRDAKFSRERLRDAVELMEAVASDDATTVAQLLRRGVDPNMPVDVCHSISPLYCAVALKRHNALRALLADSRCDPSSGSPCTGESALGRAVIEKDHMAVQFLLEDGATFQCTGSRGISSKTLKMWQRRLHDLGRELDVSEYED